MNRPTPNPSRLREGNVRVGMGGWTYEPWRGTFYPRRHPHGRELDFAARAVTAIEIAYVFFIAGAKLRAPAAAMALLNRL